MHPQLPNLLSLARLTLIPPLLVAAILAQSRIWFFGLLCLAWTTDALDGFLARRFRVESEFGRKLDSWGDYITTLFCVIGLIFLWPDIARQEWPWFAAGILGFFFIVVYGLLRWREAPCYHTWLAKLIAIAFPFAFAALLAGWSASPFHWTMAGQIAATIEEFVISLLLPGVSRSIPTVWHAWRQRQTFRSSTQ